MHWGLWPEKTPLQPSYSKTGKQPSLGLSYGAEKLSAGPKIIVAVRKRVQITKRMNWVSTNNQTLQVVQEDEKSDVHSGHGVRMRLTKEHTHGTAATLIEPLELKSIFKIFYSWFQLQFFIIWGAFPKNILRTQSNKSYRRNSGIYYWINRTVTFITSFRYAQFITTWTAPFYVFVRTSLYGQSVRTMARARSTMQFDTSRHSSCIVRLR